MVIQLDPLERLNRFRANSRYHLDGVKTCLVVFFALIITKMLFSGIQEGSESMWVDISLLLVSSIGLVMCKGVKYLRIVFLLIPLPLAYVFSSYYYDIVTITSLSSSMKIIVPAVMLAFLCSAMDEDCSPYRSFITAGTKMVLLSVVFLEVFGLLFFSKIIYKGDVVLAVYFANVHTNSYVLICIVMWLFAKVSSAYKLTHIFVYTSVLLALISLMVFAWGVRTPILAFIVFIVVYYSEMYLAYGKKYFVYFFMSFCAIFFMLFFPDYGSADLFTSGRLSMYSEKLSLLSMNTVFSWVFGSGYGSDIIETDIWWWAKRDSHNDYLSILTESGLVGLISVLAYFWEVSRRLAINPISKSMLYAFLATSLVSNGLMFRPVASYLFFIVFSLSVSQLDNEDQ